MKKIFIILAIAMLASCTTTTSVDAPNTNPEPKPKVKIEWLSNEVDHGLSKVILDDSTTILIYRGVESCTMIQLKK